MIKTMPIDYVRCVLETTLKSYASGTQYFNNTDISLFSFYEQLTEDEEVNRYVERYNELVKQQNKMDRVGFGILAITDNPTITNLKKGFVSPFEWSCTIRCTLANRDKMISTIYKLIEDLKGRKQDVALLDNGKLIPVGTIANNGELWVKPYDFVGEYDPYNDDLGDILDSFLQYDIDIDSTEEGDCYYTEWENKLHLYKAQENASHNISWVDISEGNIPEHNSFEKMKIDLSFDDIKVDEPFTLDSTQFCNITFGGTATLVNNGIRLGNDLVAVGFRKLKVKGATDYEFQNQPEYLLEPLEMPSGLNANTLPNQLRSNYFKANTHTDSIAISLQYTFLYNSNDTLLEGWFEYGRYGINHLESGELGYYSITPNIIYRVREWWISWGEVKLYEFKAKIVEDIDIENTESDVMTIGIAMQVQGDND